MRIRFVIRSWLFSFAIALLLWVAIVTAAESNGTTVNVPFDSSWGALFSNASVVGVLGLVVKWFMSHVEGKDRAFVEMVTRKETAYEALANACNKSHEESAARLLDAQQQLAEAIRQLTDRK